jgi:hypothetical protein
MNRLIGLLLWFIAFVFITVALVCAFFLPEEFKTLSVEPEDFYGTVFWMIFCGLLGFATATSAHSVFTMRTINRWFYILTNIILVISFIIMRSFWAVSLSGPDYSRDGDLALFLTFILAFVIIAFNFFVIKHRLHKQVPEG